MLPGLPSHVAPKRGQAKMLCNQRKRIMMCLGVQSQYAENHNQQHRFHDLSFASHRGLGRSAGTPIAGLSWRLSRREWRGIEFRSVALEPAWHPITASLGSQRHLATVCFLGAPRATGQFTGEISHLTGTPAIFRAVARGDCEVFEISVEALRHFVKPVSRPQRYYS